MHRGHYFLVTLTARLSGSIESTFCGNTTFIVPFPQNRSVEKQVRLLLKLIFVTYHQLLALNYEKLLFLCH